MANYTTERVISSHRRFYKDLYSDPKQRDLFIALLVDTMPDEWVDEHYGEILNQIRKMAAEGKSQEGHQKHALKR